MKAEIIPSLCAGTELDIVNAARKSFDTEHAQFTESDKNLLLFLMREGHWLPFRHPQLSFACEAPMFVARQLGKHQVGMSWSEISRRYKTSRIRFWVPNCWRETPENAKQGTGPNIFFQDPKSVKASKQLHRVYLVAEEAYKKLLEIGVAPEQARAVLPQSTYVYWTWTGSLLAWLHLIRERNHPNVQTETRQFVMNYIAPVVQTKFPLVYEELMRQIKE